MSAELAAEMGRWQDTIRAVLIRLSGAPDSRIDGGGCDGDPLDVTLAEIEQAFAWADNARLSKDLSRHSSAVSE